MSTILTLLFHVNMLRRCGVSSTSLNEDSDSDSDESWPERFNVGSYNTVPRHFVYGHFVYDTSSTDISSTDFSSTTVYQRVGQLYIQLLFQQIIILINSNFYLHYDLFLSIPLPLTL